MITVTYLDGDEPETHQLWQCPCPKCNGVRPDFLDPEDEEEAGAWTEPSAEALTPSEWVWAE